MDKTISLEVAIRFKKWFPQADVDDYELKSKINPSYNCAAWAACETKSKWWPTHLKGYFWPKGIGKEATIDNFILAYELQGYKVCESHDLEEGFEKIAIYAIGEEVQHVARQLASGKWTSKVGDYEDIEHKDVLVLSSPVYGKPVKFMQRSFNREKAVPDEEKI
jgi:hypothetical protein